MFRLYIIKEGKKIYVKADYSKRDFEEWPKTEDPKEAKVFVKEDAVFIKKYINSKIKREKV